MVTPADSESDWKSFRRARNCVTENLRKDKKKHIEKLFEKVKDSKDSKALFRIMKEKLGWNTGGPPTALIKDGVIISKPIEIAVSERLLQRENK